MLDFGCGWGRLTRMLAKDLEPGLLHGCDPAQSILDVIRKSGVPAELELSEFLPESLPFEEKFDLVFSFSVFTHISETAATKSLEAIHKSLNDDGLFVVTIRPPSYIDFNPLMQPAVDRLGPDRLKVLRDPHYVFVPHETEGHPQFGGEEMHLRRGRDHPPVREAELDVDVRPARRQHPQRRHVPGRADPPQEVAPARVSVADVRSDHIRLEVPRRLAVVGRDVEAQELCRARVGPRHR